MIDGSNYNSLPPLVATDFVHSVPYAHRKVAHLEMYVIGLRTFMEILLLEALTL